MNWWASTHDGHSTEAQSKHLATAKAASLDLQAVQVAEFQPLSESQTPPLVESDDSDRCDMDDEKSLNRLEDVCPLVGGVSRQSALQTGQHPDLSKRSPSRSFCCCCLSQQGWQRACKQGSTLGKTENESLTPQTAHLVARPGLDTPLLLVLELHPGNPPLGGRLLVPLLLTLKLSL